MKTDSMQTRLEDLYRNDRIESGKKYDIMPSDCSGNGYDVALMSRRDESGDYIVDGHLMRVINTIRVGSDKWRNGIPCGYSLEIDPEAPYTLKNGEKAVVCYRAGNKIGNSGYMHRVIASIAIVRANGSKIYNGHTPYWIASSSTYAAHYASGMSKADQAAFNAEWDRLQAIVDQINNTGAQIAQKEAA